MNHKEYDKTALPQDQALEKQDSQGIEVVAEEQPLDKQIIQLKKRMLNLVSSSIEVLECAVNRKNFRNSGKLVTKTQIIASAPIVNRFAPELETLSSGAVHLHLNIPRPTKEQVIIDAANTTLTALPQAESSPKAQDNPKAGVKIPGKFKK